MNIEELIVFKEGDFTKVEQEKFIILANENLLPLKEKVAKEKEASVIVKKTSLSVQGFQDEEVAKKVFAVIYDMLNQ